MLQVFLEKVESIPPFFLLPGERFCHTKGFVIQEWGHSAPASPTAFLFVFGTLNLAFFSQGNELRNPEMTSNSKKMML